MRPISLCLVLLFSLPGPVDASVGAPQIAFTDLDPRDDLLHALAVLKDGTRQEKHDLVRVTGKPGPFRTLPEVLVMDPRSSRWILAEIRDWAAVEEDNWVLDRTAASLARMGFEELAPLFRDLARHPAPSVRYRTVQYVGSSPLDGALELLEEMWAVEQVPWLRAWLVIFLVTHESEVPVSACRDLIWDQEIGLAMVAIRCLQMSDPPDAGKALAERASWGNLLLRRAALQAVRDWLDENYDTEGEVGRVLEKIWKSGAEASLQPDLLLALAAADSESLMEATTESLWSSHREVARTSIRILGEEDTAESDSPLMRRAGEGSLELRAAAILALDARRLTPEVESFLVAATAPGRPTQVRLAAVEALSAKHAGWFFGDPYSRRQHLKPLIEEIAATDPDQQVRDEARSAVARFETDTIIDTTCCPPKRRFSTPLVVLDPKGGQSIRCWVAPDAEAEPESAARVATGGRVRADDRFDDGEFSWRHFFSGNTECWVPSENLRPVYPAEEKALDDAIPPDHELDVAIAQTTTASFRRLEKLGLVTTFDRGENLIAVRLTDGPIDAEEWEALLQAAGEWTGTRLGDAVRSLLEGSKLAVGPEEPEGVIRNKQRGVPPGQPIP